MYIVLQFTMTLFTLLNFNMHLVRLILLLRFSEVPCGRYPLSQILSTYFHNHHSIENLHVMSQVSSEDKVSYQHFQCLLLIKLDQSSLKSHQFLV